jgi:uncharacterized protein YjbI with pentapeptide repeats
MGIEGAEDRSPAVTAPGEEERNTTLPAVAAQADNLDAIRKSVEDAAGLSGGLWLSYLFVLFYIAIAAGAVTHVDLLLENPVKLPFLSVELPLKAFFLLAPLLFLISHAYTLANLVLVADKAKLFDRKLDAHVKGQGAGSKSETNKELVEPHQDVRRQLPSNIFVQVIAGPDDIRAGWFGALLKMIAWTSLIIGPVLLLLLLQIQFLPYHHSPITWTHRLALLADLLLIWWLWPKILPRQGFRHRTSRTKPALGLVTTLAALIFSWAVATFPGEWQEDHLRSFRPMHEWLFAGEVDVVTRRRKNFLSSTLVLPGLDIYEALKIDDPNKLEWKERSIDLRGRHLEQSMFDGANLRKADLSGAYLEGASLLFARLQGARLDAVQLQGATLMFTSLQGASLQGAQLQGAYLLGVQFSGATLDNAQIQGAFIIKCMFLGASLINLQLQGAWLANSEFWGASLEGARLSGALLVGTFAATDMTKAVMWRAHGEPEVTQVLASELAWSPQFIDESSDLGTWSQDKYQALRQNMMRSIPPGEEQAGALKRIESLDCAKDKLYLTEQVSADLAPCDAEAKPPASATELRRTFEAASVDPATYSVHLAKTLGDAVCKGEVIAESIAASSRLMSELEKGKVSRFTAAGLNRLWTHPDIGSIHVLRGLLANGRLKASGAQASALAARILSKDCPVSAALSEDDKTQLRALQKLPDKAPAKN